MGLHSTCYSLEAPLTLFALAASKVLLVFQQPFIEVTSTEVVYLREANVMSFPDTQCMFTDISGEQMCVGNGFPTRLRLQPDKNLKLGLQPLSIAELNYNTSYNASAPVLISDPLFLKQDIFPEPDPETKAIATEVLQGAERQREISRESKQRVQMSPLRSPNVNCDESEEENGEEDTDIKWWSLEPEIDTAENENDKPQIQHDDAILLEPDTRYCLFPDTGRDGENDSPVVADNNSGNEDGSCSDGSSDSDSEDEADTDSSVEFISTSIDPFPVSAEISDYWQDQMLKKIKVEPLSDEETKIEANIEVTVVTASTAHDVKSVPPVKRKKCTRTGKKPYQCQSCDKTFLRSQYLTKHLRTHTSEKPYKCEVCGSSFSQSGSLRTHRRTHTGERPYKCEVCGSSFSQSGSLQAHRRTHTGERPYQCESCGKAFSQSNHLKKHRRTHTGERPYQCEFQDCGKTFLQSESLKKHLLTHTGEKPFKCEVKDCGRAFSQISHLTKHRRTHTGEKPYRCENCGKAFSQSSTRNKHLRTHTGKKPYQCENCGKVFSQSGSLNKHLRTHTGKEPKRKRRRLEVQDE